jgi:hypothetical protein
MGSVNYIFTNTGQTVRLIVQVLGNDGHPVDLDGYGNWLDGYGYLLPDGYYSDPPDGYYSDGYSNGSDGYSCEYPCYYRPMWISCERYTTDHREWHRWWGNHDQDDCFHRQYNYFDGYYHRHHGCFHTNYRGPNDGYYVPVVQQVMFPDLSLAAYYPRPMTRIGVGLYIHGLCIPNGAPAIGTYIASISWTEDVVFKWETYAINASRPFGTTSVSPV